MESITKDWSILTLAHKVIEGSQCTVSAPLCARLVVMVRPKPLFAYCVTNIMLQRSVYPQASGHDYWDKIDARLEFYRGQAEGSAEGI